MPRLAGVLFVVLALVGCSTQSLRGPPYSSPAMEEPPQAASIVGHGAYKRQSGGRVTCAGYSVVLMPASAAYAQRVAALYGPPSARVMVPVAEVKARSAKLPPSPAPAATSTCDANGEFGFSHVQAGGYFLIAHVKQKTAANRMEDYVILKRIVLEPGAAADISLAP